jgi:hypothetical protein
MSMLNRLAISPLSSPIVKVSCRPSMIEGSNRTWNGIGEFPGALECSCSGYARRKLIERRHQSQPRIATFGDQRHVID